MQGKVPHTLMSLLGRVMELERIKRKGGDEIKSILDVGAEKKAWVQDGYKLMGLKYNLWTHFGLESPTLVRNTNFQVVFKTTKRTSLIDS